MNKVNYISFRISNSQVDSTGRYRQASVTAVGGTLLGVAVYQKLLVDIIAHALTLTGGVELSQSERFTYTFPFKLA